MTVNLIAWDDAGAVAVIDGTRCRIRKSHNDLRWICGIHGTRPTPHCHHLEQFAAHPAEPEKRRHA